MQQKQVVTIAINCDKLCPSEKPDCCLDCEHMKARNEGIELVEVLHDIRENDEQPPCVTAAGEIVENN